MIHNNGSFVDFLLYKGDLDDYYSDIKDQKTFNSEIFSNFFTIFLVENGSWSSQTS